MVLSFTSLPRRRSHYLGNITSNAIHLFFSPPFFCLLFLCLSVCVVLVDGRDVQVFLPASSLPHHLVPGVCSALPLSCPFACNTPNLSKSRLEEHMKACGATLIRCPFARNSSALLFASSSSFPPSSSFPSLPSSSSSAFSLAAALREAKGDDQDTVETSSLLCSPSLAFSFATSPFSSSPSFPSSTSACELIPRQQLVEHLSTVHHPHPALLLIRMIQQAREGQTQPMRNEAGDVSPSFHLVSSFRFCLDLTLSSIAVRTSSFSFLT